METETVVYKVLPAHEIQAYFEGGRPHIPTNVTSRLKRRLPMNKTTNKNSKTAKKRRFRMLPVLALTALIVYLFVTAPSPLPEDAQAGQTIPISDVLTITAAENDIVRALWTKEIVGKGKQAGLAFGEDWRERGVEKGPLPALFLREMAMSLEKNPAPLSVFLGSDYPIAEANNFDGIQTEMFEKIKPNHEPQFFYSEDTQRHTAMFADIAVAPACVTCHNEHPQSPKAVPLHRRAMVSVNPSDQRQDADLPAFPYDPQIPRRAGSGVLLRPLDPTRPRLPAAAEPGLPEQRRHGLHPPQVLEY